MKVVVREPGSSEIRGAVTVVGVFADLTTPAGLDPEHWSRLRLATRFRADNDELLVVPDSSDPLLLIGLEDRSLSTLRDAMAKAARRLSRFPRIATYLASDADQAAAVVEGVMHGAYGYPARTNEIAELVLVTPADVRRRVDEVIVVESAAEWARDLINQPANVLTPTAFADEARTMARAAGLDVRVKDADDLRQGGFGGLLAVGSGSANAPCLIEVTYAGHGGEPASLVGKGITFDSGGLIAKGKGGMLDMRTDMAGAATVLAATKAAAALDCSRPISALAAVAENMSGSRAYRPGDVITHRGGKTSEVVDTDAEGRVVLADALAYAAESRPAAIVDVATLTYDVIRALGDQVGGILGNDRALIQSLLQYGERAGEPMWELPLWAGYRDNVKSPVADVRNDGGSYGDAIHAALFLAEFVGDVPWAHLDIAGTAFIDDPDRPDYGATGVAVRTLTQWLSA